jgi:hypothetical protein
MAARILLEIVYRRLLKRDRGTYSAENKLAYCRHYRSSLSPDKQYRDARTAGLLSHLMLLHGTTLTPAGIISI